MFRCLDGARSGEILWLMFCCFLVFCAFHGHAAMISECAATLVFSSVPATEENFFTSRQETLLKSWNRLVLWTICVEQNGDDMLCRIPFSVAVEPRITDTRLAHFQLEGAGDGVITRADSRCCSEQAEIESARASKAHFRARY